MTTDVQLNTALLNPVHSLLGIQLRGAIDQKNENEIDRILSDPSARLLSSTDLGYALVNTLQVFREQFCSTILELPAAFGIPPMVNGVWARFSGHLSNTRA